MSREDPFAVIARALGAGHAEPARPAIRSYAALGDSFTAGAGCGPGERWADRLAARLGARNPEFAYRNLAVDGATSTDVLEQLGAALQLEPDLATVVCGANDVLFSVRPDIAAYALRLTAIFGGLRDAVGGIRIMTATAPERWHFLDLGPRTRRRIHRGIVELNRATREVASTNGVACLDVADHPGLAESANFGADGLHPSPRAHSQAALGFERLLEA